LFACYTWGLSTANSAARVDPYPPDFVDAADVVHGLMVEMRYFSIHNFVGDVITGYEASRCILTVQAAKSLANVDNYLRENYRATLKVYDCYRPQMAVDHFYSWSLNISDTKMKVTDC